MFSFSLAVWLIVLDDDQLIVRHDGRDVLAYQVAMKSPPDEITKPVAGDGFLHPVRTPSGAIVTDDFPPDHPHQHGLFYAWTKTTFRGHRVDFWNTHKGLGRVEHRELISSKRGRQFTVGLDHVDLTGNERVVAMQERREYAVSYVDQPRPAYFIDVSSTLEAATDDPVTLEEYLYGGMACRGARGWTIDAGHRFATADGDDRAKLNHTSQRWVASTGPVDGQPRTIALLSHPGNVRSPQPVRLHPEMPYFVFSPTVNEPLVVSKDQPLVQRYRYIVHDGEPSVDELEAWTDEFAKLPAAK